MADAGGARQRRARHDRGEVAELALGPPPLDHAVHQRGDAGAVVAAVFQPVQRIEDHRGRRPASDHAHDPAHQPGPFLRAARNVAPRPCLTSCRARPKAIASCGTSAVMTLPAATNAPSAMADGRHQYGVRAHEYTGADGGTVLGEAVIVAGDGAGADVAAGAYFRVAKIGQVVGLGTGTQPRRLQLHEVADMGGRLHHRAGSQPGKRSDDGASPDLAALRDG